MSISTELRYATLDELCLDPLNPRLGRNNARRTTTQTRVLQLMEDWSLEELAVSFLESGYWPQEALITTHEKLYGKNQLVVIEGNRRLAALKLLRSAVRGQKTSRTFKELIRGQKVPALLFKRIPYMLATSRTDIEAFLGFRHVTGIKEWRPAEKAEFIAKLLDSGKSYEHVMRKIGSKTSTVRQNYIAYRLLLQMEAIEEISADVVERRFSVLYLSLRTEGVQKYLHINLQSSQTQARRPVPAKHVRALTNFALWLFGDKKREPIITDSRQVDQFGHVLLSKEAVAYLERTERPDFGIAVRIAGGDEPEILRLINRASDNIELALMRAHLFGKSKKVQEAVFRLYGDSSQLFKLFPTAVQSAKRTLV